MRYGQQWPLMMAEGGAEGTGSPGGATDPGAGASQGTALGGSSAESAGAPGSLMDWRSTYLSEEQRRDGFFQQFADIPSLVKTAKSQAEMIGRGIFLPRDDAPPEAKVEAMQKIYDRLGRPKDSRGYALPEGIELPGGAQLDDGFVQGLQEYAWQSGLNQDQYSALVQLSAQTLRNGHNLMEARKAQSYAEGLNALGKAFGAQAMPIQQKCVAFFEHFGQGAFGGDEGRTASEAIREATLPDGSLLINNPAIVYAFSRAFEHLGEGEFFQSEFYRAGISTSDTLSAREIELAEKANAGTITAAEKVERQRIAEQLVQMRQREAERGSRRVA